MDERTLIQVVPAEKPKEALYMAVFDDCDGDILVGEARAEAAWWARILASRQPYTDPDARRKYDADCSHLVKWLNLISGSDEGYYPDRGHFGDALQALNDRCQELERENKRLREDLEGWQTVREDLQQAQAELEGFRQIVRQIDALFTAVERGTYVWKP